MQHTYWQDERGQLVLEPSSHTPTNIYRVEIGGQDEVQYIEAEDFVEALRLALHDLPRGKTVTFQAEQIADDTTLAAYANANPGLFGVQ